VQFWTPADVYAWSLRYDSLASNFSSTLVDVVPDMDPEKLDSRGKSTRWTLTPLDEPRLVQEPASQFGPAGALLKDFVAAKKANTCVNYGTFRMPFKIVLEQLQVQ
jgi:hypothetical protein